MARENLINRVAPGWAWARIDDVLDMVIHHRAFGSKIRSDIASARAAMTTQATAYEIDWSLPVRAASELPDCPDCGEPWCDECQMHYAECRHPGPDSSTKV